jgi:hypothetical protein
MNAVIHRLVHKVDERGVDTAIRAHWGRQTFICPVLRERMREAIRAYCEEIGKIAREKQADRVPEWQEWR